MELLLKRETLTDESTIGILFAPDSTDGKLKHMCFILEDPVRPKKIKGITAIPAGRYKVVITHSPKFGRRMPLLLNVPNFEGIRIHPGNDADDTEGCLLPGTGRTNNKVTGSRDAYNILYEYLVERLSEGNEIWLKITNPPSATAPLRAPQETRERPQRQTETVELDREVLELPVAPSAPVPDVAPAPVVGFYGTQPVQALPNPERSVAPYVVSQVPNQTRAEGAPTVVKVEPVQPPALPVAGAPSVIGAWLERLKGLLTGGVSFSAIWAAIQWDRIAALPPNALIAIGLGFVQIICVGAIVFYFYQDRRAKRSHETQTRRETQAYNLNLAQIQTAARLDQNTVQLVANNNDLYRKE